MCDSLNDLDEGWGVMAGRCFDLEFDLLDRQIVDAKGRMAGKVDDLELTFPEDGSAPYVSGIHSGTGALASRLTSRLGPWLESVASRLTNTEHPNLIWFGLVKRVGTEVDVIVEGHDLPGLRLEKFFSDNVIGHIPGARHEAK
jgi:sporulation protein YlmC with PRC-barrel domain